MIDHTLKPLPKVRRSDIVDRGLRCQCPNCGQAKIFRSTLKINHRCPYCGMTLERGDGYYLGPLCINYGIAVFGVVAPLLLAGFAGWIPFRPAMIAAGIAALLLPLLFYRLSWSLWLMSYYFCLPDELHANRPEDCDELLFEEEQRNFEH
ncbi:DUF983 domain-containing protein [Coraliomargarita sp. SDUM461004]|uniref:DUF983 domain-containing protein n=1 Tax=Thalassobacterium sedimentorum TaxID=3041258 RepID=A0ABU1AIS0_9BACT|nr:DUF983 domain-containing protein [Coraliomargarita sp. SDUM461004]MDQ8194717.1 DUF983 domain-containing protein [Coraliomargarita sp. SDUM461004]